MSQIDSSLLDRLQEEVGEYRRMVAWEVRAHIRFSRITVLTGGGLVAGGVGATYYYPAIGWLLVIVGLLRVLNSLYDFQRKDELQRRLRLLEEKYGDLSTRA